MITRRNVLTTTVGGLLSTSLPATPATAQQEDRLQWAFEAGSAIESSPTIIDGTVFVGSWDDNLYAVAADTGEQEWVFKAGSDIDSSPTVVDDTVFVGSADSNLYAVAADTGEQEWAFETDGAVYSSPTVAGGTVFAGSADGSLYAVAADTGEQEWAFETDGAVYSSPTVVDSTVFFGSWDDSLYAVAANTGEQEWAFETDYDISSSPTVAGGTVFVGSSDGNLYAVAANTGEQEWAFETGGAIYRSSPTVAGGTVFVGSSDGNLYAVTANTGEQEWAFETGSYINLSSPTVVDSTVFFGSWDDNLYAVATDTGEREWAFETDYGISSSPTVVDGTVFAGSSDGNLYAVAADVGGSSEGSRTQLEALGHHGEWRYNNQPIDATPPDSETPNLYQSWIKNNVALIVGCVGSVIGGGYLIRRRRKSAEESRKEALRSASEGSDSGTAGANGQSITASEKPTADGESTVDNYRTAAKEACDSSANDNTNHESMNPDTIPSSPRLSLSYNKIDKIERLGSGGNADVYKATATTESGEVPLAIKEPRMGGTTVDTDTIDQTLDEAKTWQQLDDHDYIVSVVDSGSTPLPWIGMECMDGGDLRERVGELSFEQSLWTALAITKGVRYAHKKGVAHLDLKPSNILFRSVEGAWDVPKVADWGLSKHLLEHSRSVEGMSPRYAAPEQLDSEQSEQVDTVTDVYQLGTVLYELFTGEPPFDGETHEVVKKIQSKTPTPPSEKSDLPEEIDDILLTALSTERDDRYDDVILLRNALRDIWDDYK